MLVIGFQSDTDVSTCPAPFLPSPPSRAGFRRNGCALWTSVCDCAARIRQGNDSLTTNRVMPKVNVLLFRNFPGGNWLVFSASTGERSSLGSSVPALSYACGGRNTIALSNGRIPFLPESAERPGPHEWTGLNAKAASSRDSRVPPTSLPVG